MQLGVDLGGTKIEAIMIDHEGGELFLAAASQPRQNDYRTTLHAIKELVRMAEKAWVKQAERGRKFRLAWAFRAPFPRNRSGQKCEFSLANRTSPRQRSLRNFRPTCQDRQRCKLLCSIRSPRRFCQGRHDRIWGYLGTGVGGGLVVKGNVIEGPNSIAGEWGHNPLPWANA